MREKPLKAIFILFLFLGFVLLMQWRRVPSAQEETRLQAKNGMDKERSPKSSNGFDGGRSASSPVNSEETFQKKLMDEQVAESLSYASHEGWIEDALHHNASKDFDRVVIHRVFADKGDADPIYTSTHLADQIVLSMDRELDDRAISEIENEYKVKLLKKLSVPNTYQFQLIDVSLKNLVETREALEKLPGVAASEYNGLQFPSMAPNDPYFKDGLMWGLQNHGKLKGQDGSTFQKDLDLGILEPWKKITDCSNTPVAVIDTGIDYNHPDLAGVVDMEESRSFTGGDPKAFHDEDSHGTHVAGTIGALGNNGLGVTGICWKSKILSLRVFGGSAAGINTAIAEAMVYFAKSSAKVANMSLGSKSPPPKIYIAAVAEVEKAGKLIIASAGNDNLNADTGNRPIGSIDSDHIIVVAAIDGNGKKASFSNFGVKDVDIAAPGVRIWSTIPKGKEANYSKAYREQGGTSMATPHVAGAVALIWSHSPSLDALSVRKVFLDFAAKKGNLSTVASEGRVLSLANIIGALQPTGKISATLKQIDLKQSNAFDVPVSFMESYVKIKTVEIMDGDTSLGMADMVGDKVRIAVPNELTHLNIRLKITDADGKVTFTDPINVKAERSKAAIFDQLALDDFLGEVRCQLKEETEGAEPVVLFDKKLVSTEFCHKICRNILPMVHSTQAKYSCGEVL